jgi:beta-galactosidase
VSQTIRVKNKRYFTDLSDVTLLWRIEGNGNVIQKGSIENLHVGPQTTELVEFTIDAHLTDDAEYFVIFEFSNKQGNDMVPAGFVVARSQVSVPTDATQTNNKPKGTRNKTTALQISESDSALIIATDLFSISFDMTSGLISDYQLQGQRMLLSDIRPEFWRAPTDNDFGEGFPEKAKDWQYAGQHTELTAFNWHQTDDSIEISTEHYLTDVQSRYLSKYTVSEDGSITFDIWFYAAPHKIHSALPRIGSLLQLPKEFEQVEWFGRGPHENYWDRKQSALVSRYSMAVDDLYYPYVRPQENGYRSDVRSVTFKNEKGLGLTFNGLPQLGFGAQRYDVHDYDQFEKRGLHPHELSKQNKLFINIDYKQRGIAGTDSWGTAPLFQYTLPWRDYHYGFVMKPYVA